MDVLPLGEGVQQPPVLGEVGHDAQLDLGVVGGDDAVAGPGDEGLADLAPLLGANRDVLQVGVAGGEPPGGGDRLVIAGVQPAGGLVDQPRQLVGVGGLQLGQAAMLHDHLGQRVVQRQLLEHRLGGGGCPLGGLLEHRDALLLEEDLAELLGGAQVELAPGKLVGAGLQLVDALRQLLALGVETRRVQGHPDALHPRQHRHQGQLDRLQHLGQAAHLRQARAQFAVQAQGDVDVLAGVGGRLLQGDLVEGELFGALAGDLLERDGLLPQVLQRQGVHVVAGGGGVQHVGLQHGVLQRPRHRDAVARQHRDVVLEVLADLGFAGILQQRLECGQHGIAVELCGGVQIVVGQRDIGRLARLKRQPHADDARLHIVQAGGLQVEAEGLGCLQAFEPGIQRITLEDHLVLAGRAAGAWCLLDGLRGRTAPGHVIPPCVTALQQLGEPGLELELAVELAERLAVGVSDVQIVEAHRQLAVGFDGGQLVGEERQVAVLLELLRQGLGTAEAELLDLLQVRIDRLEATAHALQQAQRGLLAHAGHAGNVVDLVAHQRQEVDDQLGGQAELRLHPFHIQGLVLHGVDQGDMGVDQLGHVLVAGGDHGVAPRLGGPAGQGADDVVGLHPLDAEQRQAQRLHAGVQRRHLGAQVVGHGRTMGLVRLEQLVPEGLARSVEDHRHGAVRIVLDQPLEHVEHTLDGTGGLAVGGGQRREGVKGAVEIGGTVDEYDGGIGHGGIH